MHAPLAAAMSLAIDAEPRPRKLRKTETVRIWSAAPAVPIICSGTGDLFRHRKNQIVMVPKMIYFPEHERAVGSSWCEGSTEKKAPVAAGAKKEKNSCKKILTASRNQNQQI
jgi:hypothetical protein